MREIGEARKAAAGPEADTIAGLIAAQAARGDVTALVATTRGVLDSKTLTREAQERLLAAAGLALAELPPDAGARSLIAALAGREPSVLVWKEHGWHAVTMPLYDPGAAARYAQRRWAVVAARDAALADLAAGSPRPVAEYAAARARDGRTLIGEGILEAFETAPLHTLPAQRAALEAALAAGEPVGELALLGGARLADVDLTLAALRAAEGAAALRALGSLGRDFASPDAVELAIAATARTDLASAAMLELGRLSQVEPRARRFLLDALGDPALGGSAAAALARLHDPGVAAALGGIVSGDADPRAVRRAILALRLDGSPAAAATLERLTADASLPAAARDELARWARR